MDDNNHHHRRHHHHQQQQQQEQEQEQQLLQLQLQLQQPQAPQPQPQPQASESGSSSNFTTNRPSFTSFWKRSKDTLTPRKITFVPSTSGASTATAGSGSHLGGEFMIYLFPF